jgi:hypothetical protein
MNKLITCFLLLAFSFATKAQVNDAGLWLNLSAEKKITQKFSTQLTQSFRLNENFSELGTSFSEIGVNYKIQKRLSVGAAYRFSQKRRVDDFYSMRHRYNIDISYKLKIKKINITLRERFQSRYKDYGTSEKGNVPKNYFRSKITMRYNLNKKYTPFISGELFYQLAEQIDNLRFKAGFDYEFNKFSSLNLYYMVDKEINVKNPWTNYVIGLGYNYSF